MGRQHGVSAHSVQQRHFILEEVKLYVDKAIQACPPQREDGRTTNGQSTAMDGKTDDMALMQSLVKREAKRVLDKRQ